MENKIVKNQSKGYNYNYASLSDIAKQGFELPKMKTGTEDGREYVYYKDGNEWIRGAGIVVPDTTKNMNKAQLYGSALTYARRYTTLMALQLTSDDDINVENVKEEIFDEPPIYELVNVFKSLATKQEQIDFLNAVHIVDVNNVPIYLLMSYNKYLNERKHNSR